MIKVLMVLSDPFDSKEILRVEDYCKYLLGDFYTLTSSYGDGYRIALRERPTMVVVIQRPENNIRNARFLTQLVSDKELRNLWIDEVTEDELAECEPKPERKDGLDGAPSSTMSRTWSAKEPAEKGEAELPWPGKPPYPRSN